jgi:hypothetical protein
LARRSHRATAAPAGERAGISARVPDRLAELDDRGAGDRDADEREPIIVSGIAMLWPTTCER